VDTAADLTVTQPPLTVLLPCYNEGEQVDKAYRAIDASLSPRYPDLELLFVDDGSTDDSLARMKRLAERDPRVRYLSFSRNFGLEAAFSAGFRYAGKPWVVQLDADLQSPPAEVPKLLARAAEGYDVVYGIRVDRRDPLARRLGSTVQQWLARHVFGVELVPGASVFRVVRTAVARRAVETRLATPYFIATLPLLGARQAAVEVRHDPRTAGRSRWRPWRLVAHSFELFIGFSLRPLVWLYAAAAVGVPLLLAAAVAAAAGWDGPGVVAVLLAAQCLLLGALALVAGYVHRLVRDTSRPAQFYIREANVPIAPQDRLYDEPAPADIEEAAL
jgi:glycosyltransferase involved in cell wall biosynthesis